MTKKLLIERMSIRPQSVLSESKGQFGYIIQESTETGRLIVKLPVTVLDQKNENGRTYSTNIMEGAMRKCEEDFKSRKLLSTVNDHPEDPYVAPGDASHIVTRSWCETGHLWNEWDILDTFNGKNLKALIEANAAIGVSIRGLGSVDKFGNILEDYEYLGTDCVGNPSARIWATPERVVSAPKNSSLANVSESVHNDGDDMSKSKKEVLNYLQEQSRLIKTEPNHVDKYKRAAIVEAELAKASLTGEDAAEVFNEWSKIKNEMGSATTESTLSIPKDTMEKLDKLGKKNSILSKFFREELSRFTKEVGDLKKKNEFIKKYSSAIVSKLTNKIKEATNKYTISVKLSGLERKKYSEAVVQGAAAIKVAISKQEKIIALTKEIDTLKSQLEALKKPITPKTPSVSLVRVEKGTTLSKSELRENAKKKDRTLTDANMSGETSMPGMI